MSVGMLVTEGSFIKGKKRGKLQDISLVGRGIKKVAICKILLTNRYCSSLVRCKLLVFPNGTITMIQMVPFFQTFPHYTMVISTCLQIHNNKYFMSTIHAKWCCKYFSIYYSRSLLNNKRASKHL